MELFPNVPQFRYMRYRYYWMVVSAILLVGSVYFWVVQGDSKWGIDFRGGVELIVRFKVPVDIATVRTHVEKADLPGATVQEFGGAGNEFSIKGAVREDKAEIERVKKGLSEISENSFEVLKQDFVGPTIGKQIRQDAIIATCIGFLVIFLYVTIRFNWVFAAGGIVSLLHDPVIAVGAALAAGRELGAPTLAGVLTIIGYSINDTVVVFDRVRENMTKAAKTGRAGKLEGMTKLTLSEIMDLSINQTLSRTLITGLSVSLVCLTLWIFGDGAVSELAFLLFIGLIVGTYSSIFIACPVCLALTGRREGASES